MKKTGVFSKNGWCDHYLFIPSGCKWLQNANINKTIMKRWNYMLICHNSPNLSGRLHKLNATIFWFSSNFSKKKFFFVKRFFSRNKKKNKYKQRRTDGKNTTIQVLSEDLKWLNPIVPNALFLYPLKTSENLTAFWCFQGVEKRCIEKKWFNAWKMAINCVIQDF